MAKKIPAEKLKEYQEVFNVYDINRDGQINTSELDTVMKVLGEELTEARLQKLINEVDLDGSGTINFDEFIKLMQKVEETDFEKAESLRAAFKVFDKDNNGFVSFDELKYILTSFGEKLTDEEVQDILHEADKDRNGKLDYEEFIAMYLEKE
ncbi:hypothetical protein PVAND_009405 [Polypedilum vanderplanki]|uniref:EF-hand domain-containing protein n=1 Tax=Polypedilum vanderplanki TaxID=319348 RepID=A0A9J6CCM5_POLVA|nr:hypothetical protein PVAND_009405 [Polypedilum vanderplanki]